METCKNRKKLAACLSILFVANMLVLSVQVSAESLEGKAEVTEPSDLENFPSAEAGGPYTVKENESIRLDGTESEAPVGDSIGYSWEITKDLTGEASLVDRDTPRPTFHAPAVDFDREIVVTLTVSDGREVTDEDEASVIVKEVLKPADFDLIDLGITPEKVSPNEIVNITANLVNTGDKTDNYRIDLFIDNELEETNTYTLNPDQSVLVQFETSRENEKTYDVRLNDLEGSFTVEESLTPYPFLIAVILFLAAGVIIVVFWWFVKARIGRRRKGGASR